jgi:phosphohistidine phosphatase
MKTLYMVRHAKSSWDDMSLSDHDRPLNGRGEKNAPEMGRRLKDRGILPDLLISSSAVRAYETARKIAKEIGYLENRIANSKNLYHADEEDIIRWLQEQEDKNNSLMIFGHNPGFTECVNLLSGAGFYNIPTCGVVAMAFETELWSEVKAGTGTLIFYDYPKKPWSSKT